MTGPDRKVDGSDKTPLTLGLSAMVTQLEALVGLQRQANTDMKASFDLIQNFGSAQESKVARAASKTLFDGGDPLAGQIKTDPEQANGPGAKAADTSQPVVPAGASAATFGGPMRQKMAQAMGQVAAAAGLPSWQSLTNLSPTYGRHAAPSTTGVPSLTSSMAGVTPLNNGPGTGGGGRHAAPSSGGRGISPMMLKAGMSAAGRVGASGLAGGASGALAAMGPAAPFVAAAVIGYGVGKAGFNFVQNQRDEGYRYQEIEGGSNLRAQRERFHEGMYARFTPGWSEGEGRQAFMDVTAMGLNRRKPNDSRVGRQEVLNTMYHAKTTLGMTESESSQFLEQAVNTTTPNLTALATALREVSNAAGEAGVNAKMARQHMFQSTQAGLQGGMGYTGAVQNAQVSQVYATWGRQYANISTDGQNDRNMIYRYAAQSGMSPGAYLNMTRSDPAGAAAVREQNTQRTLDAFITAEMKSWIKSRVSQEQQAHGRVDEATLDSIGEEFRAGPGAQLNPIVIVDVIKSQTGMSGVDLENWPGFVVRSVVGRTKGAEAARAIGSTAMVGTDGKYVSGPLKGQQAQGRNHQGANINQGKQQHGSWHHMFDRSEPGRGAVGQFTDGAKSMATAGWDFVGGAFHLPGGDLNEFMGKNKNNKGKEAYAAWSKRNHGASDPVIESLLHVKDMNPDNQKVSVQVKGKDGKPERRYMTMTEAIKDYHNQVVSGDMYFENGKFKGKSYQSIGGLAGDTSRDISKSVNDTKKAGKYDTAKEFNHDEEHGSGWNPFDGKKGLWAKFKGYENGKGDNKSKMGEGKLDLTDDAKRLLKLLPGDKGAAAAEGAPPDASGAVTGR